MPLVSIRSLLRDEHYQQSLDDGTWGRELVSWEGHPEFEEGMFVARVLGDAMAPAIPADSYCLFRKVGDALPDGEVMLVQHPKINDPYSGGDWTVRKATYTGAVSEANSWKHGQLKLEPESTAVATTTNDLTEPLETRLFGKLVEVLG